MVFALFVCVQDLHVECSVELSEAPISSPVLLYARIGQVSEQRTVQSSTVKYSQVQSSTEQ